MTTKLEGQNNFTVEAEFTYVVDSDDPMVVESFLDNVAEHLCELDAEDVSIILDQVAREFSVSLLIRSNEGESAETVVGKAMGLWRTAFHACNARTPEWPTTIHEALQGVRVRRVKVREPVHEPDPMQELASV
jgi:hypothetical protein